ncbi:unnamed protein product [Mytilus edulis]|uniref:Caspase family p10 domain-containing protein n=1 Tax=Mytilus edulis TaxID=6550 RepID=A0A8S3RNC2_MYTED|nr:unnamed protein product [Mytilus edulis]
MMASTSEWNGSYFIKSLCDVLCTHGQELPLHSIFEKLKQAVKNSCGTQSIEITDSTTKVISFVPNRDVCQTCTNLIVNRECGNCEIVEPNEQNQIADNCCAEPCSVSTAINGNIETGNTRIVLIGKSGEGKVQRGTQSWGKRHLKKMKQEFRSLKEQSGKQQIDLDVNYML